MNKKLSLLFILISLSMLGIIYFQADWVYKSSIVHADKLETDASTALSLAAKHLKKDYQDSVTQALRRKLYDPQYNVTIKFSNDSLLLHYRYKSNSPAVMTIGSQGTMMKIEVTYPNHNSKPDYYKNVNKLVRAALLSINNTPFADSIKILKYYQSELKRKNINQNFKLAWFKSDQIPSATLSELYKYKVNKVLFIANYPTSSFYIDGKQQFVVSYFYNLPELKIVKVLGHFFRDGKPLLKNLTSLLALSAFLIITTICWFILLFRIILRQKHIADMKADFINNMTHELKTPIATISAAVEGMQNFNVLQDKVKTERYLDTMSNELMRLNNLVTKVLQMAAYQKKKTKLEVKYINIEELIEEVTSAEKLKANKIVHITFSNPQNISTLKADAIHFRNVFTNLIDNAIKYSNNPVEIKISCYADKRFINFSIKDNGIGIAASQIPRIFDKFHRVSTGNIHNIKGTGLGLSYVKNVVEMHKGHVSVKSTLGSGSEFIISLPFK